MKKYLITSDKYLPLLRGYPYFFNKHWSSEEEVTVLCYKKPDFDLTDNFKTHSLGKQSDYGRYWTNALIPYFKAVNESYFLILLEDLFLRIAVDIDTLNEMESMVADGVVQKAHLSKPMKEGGRKKIVSDNIVEINKSEAAVLIRTTTQPSIWNKKHFLNYLKPNRTAWQFETDAKRMASKEEAIVVAPKNSRIFHSMNILRRGRFNLRGMNGVIKNGYLDKEDIEVVMQFRNHFPIRK